MVRMTNSKMKWLYYLIDPRTKKVMYVGISFDPIKRLGGHKSQKDNKKKFDWIKELKREGLSPELRFVVQAETKQAKALESQHIRKFGVENLLNKRAEDLQTKFEMRVDMNELLELKKRARIFTDGNVSEYVRAVIAEINSASVSDIMNVVEAGKEKIKRKRRKLK